MSLEFQHSVLPAAQESTSHESASARLHDAALEIVRHPIATGVAVVGGLALAKLLPVSDSLLRATAEYLDAEPVLKCTAESIPEFDALGRLPAGRYKVDWADFASRFINNDRRSALGQGMLTALNDLKTAGAKEVEVGGSFVSNKPEPGDFDMVWLTKRLNMRKLPAALIDTPKATYGGHIFDPAQPYWDLRESRAVPPSLWLSTARDGSRYGTMIVDLTKPLPLPLNSVAGVKLPVS